MFGLTSPLGWLPAEKAENRPSPSLRRIDFRDDRTRAELPVQRNKTLRSFVSSHVRSFTREIWRDVCRRGLAGLRGVQGTPPQQFSVR